MRTIIFKKNRIVYSCVVESEDADYYYISMRYRMDREGWIAVRENTSPFEKYHPNLHTTESVFPDVIPFTVNVNLAIDFLIFDSMEAMEPCQR